MMGRVKQVQPFRLPKRRLLGFRALFLLACFLFPAIYTYNGFQPYPADASAPVRLSIPDINLSTPVDNIEKINAKLDVPEIIAGAYTEHPSKTLVVGHSNTVFKQLDKLSINSKIIFDDQAYQITDVTTKAKSQIDMSEILAPTTKNTIILMTCAGQHLSGRDYSHRLIITATLSEV